MPVIGFREDKSSRSLWEEEKMKGCDERSGKGGQAKWKEGQKDNEERGTIVNLSHTRLSDFLCGHVSHGERRNS